MSHHCIRVYRCGHGRWDKTTFLAWDFEIGHWSQHGAFAAYGIAPTRSPNGQRLVDLREVQGSSDYLGNGLSQGIFDPIVHQKQPDNTNPHLEDEAGQSNIVHGGTDVLVHGESSQSTLNNNAATARFPDIATNNLSGEIQGYDEPGVSSQLSLSNNPNNADRFDIIESLNSNEIMQWIWLVSTKCNACKGHENNHFSLVYQEPFISLPSGWYPRYSPHGRLIERASSLHTPFLPQQLDQPRFPAQSLSFNDPYYAMDLDDPRQNNSRNNGHVSPQERATLQATSASLERHLEDEQAESDPESNEFGSKHPENLFDNNKRIVALPNIGNKKQGLKPPRTRASLKRGRPSPEIPDAGPSSRDHSASRPLGIGPRTRTQTGRLTKRTYENENLTDED